MIPFEYPQIQLSYRIAIIGSEPTKGDLVTGQPFSEGLGKLLSSLLHRADIQRSACLLGYACQELGRFSDQSYQKLNSLEELKYAITDFNPNVCVLLGDYAYRICDKKPSYPSARGGLFIAEHGPLLGRKCLSSFSLMDTMKVPENLPLLAFDLKRAREEGESPELVLPQREFLIGFKAHEIVAWLDSVQTPISFDIEGGGASPISMLSIATSPLEVLHIMPLTPSNPGLVTKGQGG
jgi:uracil-DNA glycosylase